TAEPDPFDSLGHGAKTSGSGCYGHKLIRHCRTAARRASGRAMTPCRGQAYGVFPRTSQWEIWMSGTGQQLYRRARTVMPGGTQLLSKRPEMFLPEQWPTYYKSAKGAEVVDLDGRTYLDMSYCGIGATILGFADPDVNAAVKTAVEAGS